MIKRFLRNLRQKPKGVRDNIALGIAGTFTAIVFMVWLHHFPSKAAVLTSQEQTKADEKPGFAGIFGDFKEQLASLKESSDQEQTKVATSSPEASNPYIATTTPVGMASSTMSTTTYWFENNETTPADTATVPTDATTSSASSFRPIRIVTTNNASSAVATTTETR